MKIPVYLFSLFVFCLTACAPVSLAAPNEPEDVVEVVQNSAPPELVEKPILTKNTCPVTLPSKTLFTPPAPYPPIPPDPGRFWYGTEALWTALPNDGHWQQLVYGEKMFWWRDGFDGSTEFKPRLSVTAQRMDAETPVVEIGPPATNAYHESFHWAMLLGVQLPSAGCWEVTGHYDQRELSFVVWVGK